MLYVLQTFMSRQSRKEREIVKKKNLLTVIIVIMIEHHQLQNQRLFASTNDNKSERNVIFFCFICGFFI